MGYRPKHATLYDLDDTLTEVDAWFTREIRSHRLHGHKRKFSYRRSATFTVLFTIASVLVTAFGLSLAV
jgi:hypothetical protein